MTLYKGETLATVRLLTATLTPSPQPELRQTHPLPLGGIREKTRGTMWAHPQQLWP